MEGFKFGKGKKIIKGVSKNEKPKNRAVLFFQIYFRKFWKLIVLNAMYLLFCIPIVTFGPATAAMTKILKNFSQERHAFVFSDFFEAFKSNFKQSFIVGIADIVLAILMSIAIYVYGSMAKDQTYFVTLLILTVSIIYALIMMNFYIFLMIVSTNLGLKDIIRNSFILTIIEIKTNIISFLIFAGTILIYYLFYPYSMFLLPLLPFSFIGLVICFNCYPIIRKHIIQPYYDNLGQLNPEFEYLVGKEDEDTAVATFKDTV